MSLLVAVYAIVMKILSLLIYQGELEDLRNSWIKDISDNTIYFTVIHTRWNNNSIGR